MNTSGDRLRAVLRECHLSASDFAANRQVTPQHVNNWFKRGIPMARLDEIAELLCINSKWLRSGEGPKHPGDQVCATLGDEHRRYDPNDNLAANDTRYIDIPFHNEQATTPGSARTHVISAGGNPVRLPLYILQAMGVDQDNAICAPMIGGSMAEKIEDGSTIAIDRGLSQIVDGEIYALEHDGMLRVKYLYRLPAGGLRLRSHNSDEYPDEIFSANQLDEQRLQILGWVFWWSTPNKRRPTVLFG